MAFLISGGGSPVTPVAASTVNLTNNNAGTVVIGAPVYSVASGAFDLADCTTAAKALVIGLVATPTILAAAIGAIQSTDVLTATTAQWDAVAGTSGGLAFGTTYYVGATPGTIIAIAPTSVGQYDTQVGNALSTTQLSIVIMPALGAIV